MSRKVSGYFIAGDAAVNVECGFVPDEVHCISALGGTELEFSFLKVLADLAVSGRYGFTYSATGVPAPASSGSGIATYDTSAIRVGITDPNSDGYAFAAMPAQYVAATAQPTARTSTAIGTLTRPSTGNETGYIYECTTDNNVFGTEPTWPTTEGGTVTDDQNNVWTARAFKTKNIGVKGFTVQAGIATNGELWAFTAEKHDRYSNLGDADVENPVTFAS